MQSQFLKILYRTGRIAFRQRTIASGLPVATVLLTLLILPAMYAVCYKIKK